MTRGIAFGILAALTLIVFAPAAEAATCPKTSLREIQAEVMCVICGVPLINAGGPQSEDERNFIRTRVDKCESKETIKAALVEEYGPQVLATPQKSGFDLTAYIVPIVVLVAALIAIILGAARWSRNRSDKPDDDNGPAGDTELDRDFQRYDL
jgi:cytochrome c-type biogenesis protein CcmH